MKARREEQIKAAHDEAMFGASSLRPSISTDSEPEVEDDKKENDENGLVTSLLSEKVVFSCIWVGGGRDLELTVHYLIDCFHGFRCLQSNKVLGATVLVKYRIDQQTDGQRERLTKRIHFGRCKKHVQVLYKYFISQVGGRDIDIN